MIAIGPSSRGPCVPARRPGLFPRPVPRDTLDNAPSSGGACKPTMATATTVTIDLRHVARGLNTPLRQVQAVVELLDEGNTVPFITRYRKDQTGGLDEEQIRAIQARLIKARQLADRKQTILRSIEAQGKLSEELDHQIRAAATAKRLEDLYLPYKPKKQTLATLARGRGLEVLAREILAADASCADLDARAADFINTDRDVPTGADALLGAGHIIAEQFSERADLRQRLRDVIQRTGKFVCAAISTAVANVGSKPEPTQAEVAPSGSETPEASSAETAEFSVATAPEVAQEPAAAPAEASSPDGGVQSEPTVAAETVPPETEVTEALAASAVTEIPAAETPAAEAPAGDAPAVAAAPEGESPATAAEEATAETTPQPAPETTPTEPTDAAEEKTDADEATEAAPPEVASTEKGADEQVAAASAPAAPRAAKRAAKQPGLSKKELKKKKAEEQRVKAFRDYFDYSEEIRKIPPHRLLAINRGERAKVLRVKLDYDTNAMREVLDELLIPADHPHADYLRGCASDALNRLILPALEREVRRELTDRAELHAVEVFAKNLRNLLLQPPTHDYRVLAVDPGFKSGCKLVALDQFGNVLDKDILFLVGKADRRKKAEQTVVDLVNRFGLRVIAIGNGTACRQTEDFVNELLAGPLAGRDVSYVIVNEAGASVYSTSRLGREEFPEYDASVRGAISIGRRLLDPLSELVKIDAANIGVGMYQHDVKAKHLRTSLDEVVESCVNYVGVDVNTASPALLRYASGLNQLTARRVYEHRRQNGPFRNREQLRAIPSFGEATFVQAAGFLKIARGDNPLDATWIHPESYEVATQVLDRLGASPDDLRSKEGIEALSQKTASIDFDELAKELQVGVLTLKDILTQLTRPGRDPREDLPQPVFKKGILRLEDLSPGMELTGTVLNVVDFGCFVDIGMHDSGLVHVSQLADKYIRDPHEVVAVGDIVRVWVMEVDKERRRVSLTMIAPGTKREPRGRRDSKPKPEEKPVGQEGQRRRSDRSRQGGTKDRPPREQRGKGPGRGRPHGKGGGRPEYRPKPKPKPVVPITDEMLDGKKPMRTFGDLAQFFQKREQEERTDVDKPAKKKKKKTPAQDDATATRPSDELVAEATATPTDAPAPAPANETPPDRVPSDEATSADVPSQKSKPDEPPTEASSPDVSREPPPADD